MRLRRASVIAALSLLAGAATATAECAWVLWSAEAFTSAVPRPSLMTGAPAQCHDGVADPCGVCRSAAASGSGAVRPCGGRESHPSSRPPNNA